MIKNVFSWYFHLPLRIHWRFLTILLKTQQTFVLVKTYWRRLEDVFSVTFFCLPRRLQDIIARSLLEDILVTSWRRRLENFLKMSCEGVLKMSSGRLEEVFGRHFAITSWRRLHKTKDYYTEDVLKTFWKRLGKQGMFAGKQKSEWSNVFSYLKVCIFWKCILCTPSRYMLK